MLFRTSARGSVCILVLVVSTGAARASDQGDDSSQPKLSQPDLSRASAAVSSSAGTLLPLTLSARVKAERAAVAVTSGYDGGRSSATLMTTADVYLAGPVAARAGFTYQPDATGEVFRPHVGVRVQLLRQERHGIDGALGVFYRMERFTEDEGMIQVLSAASRRFDALTLFANVAYGQDPEGDDRDGELRLAAQYAVSSILQLGLDGKVRVDLFSTDARRAMRGTSDLDFAVGPLATLTIGRFALLGQVGASGVRAGVLRTGLLATLGAASVF